MGKSFQLSVPGQITESVERIDKLRVAMHTPVAAQYRVAGPTAEKNVQKHVRLQYDIVCGEV